MRNLILISVTLLLVGCYKFIELTPEMKKFEYTYQVPGKDKKKIWKLARNHFASSYGDVRSVISVMDEEEGTMIGKGNVSWCFDPPICSVICWNDYRIRFDAEDGKAKLKINLVKGLKDCRLTEEGYERIKNHFYAFDLSLKGTLLE